MLRRRREIWQRHEETGRGIHKGSGGNAADVGGLIASDIPSKLADYERDFIAWMDDGK